MRVILYTLLTFVTIVTSVAALDLSRVSAILSEKRIDPYTRFWKADTLISKQRNLDSLGVVAYRDMLLPFAESSLRDKNERAIAMSWGYGKLDYYYAKCGLFEPSLASARKGVDYILQSDSNRYIAEAFDYLATKEDKYGDRGRSIEATLSAIDYFKRVRGSEQRLNICYYQLSIYYSATEDRKSLWDIVTKMEAVARSAPDSFAYYQYYCVKASYYFPTKEEHRNNSAFTDSSILYSKKAIEIHSRYPGKTLYRTPISYAYLNVAILYDFYLAKDTVIKYLELAEFHRDLRDDKLPIPLGILWARQDYRDREYARAEKRIFEILQLIKKCKTNDMLVDKCDALELMVSIYEQTGRLEGALAYQKLYIDAYKERFDFEADNTLQNLTVRYETRQKEQEIALLTEKSENYERWIYASIVFVLLLLLALLAGAYSYYLRKRADMQNRYEAAMEAEIKMNEFSTTTDEPLQRLSERFVDKLTAVVQRSSLPEDCKHLYLGKLSDIDLNQVDLQYESSIEPLSTMDMKYILCFWVDMSAADIASLFNIEAKSVYTVRYRIKKKFDKQHIWPII